MVKKPDVQYIRFVTDGSSARKAETVKPQCKTQLPALKKKKDKVIRLDPLAMLGIVVSVVMLVLMLVNLFSLSAMQEQTTQMYRYVSYLQSENARLTEQYASSYDLHDIRNQALALGMVPVEQVTHLCVQLPQEDADSQNAGTMLVSGLE